MKYWSLLLCMLCATVATARAEDIVVQDFAQRTVRLPSPAQRIVALAPHIVENVFSAGAGDRLVGVVDYSDYPAAAQDIPRVGNYRSWSLEGIAELQPDLILMWGSGNGMQKLASLERLDVPVFVSEPKRLDDIALAIRRIGELSGTRDVSEVESRRIDAKLDELRRRYARKAPLSLLYQVWNEPLQTLNGQHIISSIIELCGARNIFADEPFLAPKITLESVLERDPDVILASGMGQARPEWLDDWRRFPNLSAVRNERLLFINPDHIQRASARMLLGAQSLCEQLATVREQRLTESPTADPGV